MTSRKSDVAESIPFDPTNSILTEDTVDGALNELAGVISDTGYAIFAIWAEESAGIANDQREWSFGNGATGDIGITLPVDAQLYAVSYNADAAGTNTEIAVVQNTSTQIGTTGTQSGQDGFNLLSSPVSVSAGDRIGFQTITGGGAVDVRVCAWFRVPISTLLDVGLGDLSDVTLSSESTDQLLQYNGTNWVNVDPTDLPFYTQTQLDAGQLDNRYYTETEIDAQQLVQDNNISTNTSNISTNASNIATNTADISQEITDRTNADNALQSQITSNDGDIATNVSNIATNTSDITELELNQDDLITLSGVPENSTDLGTFTGSTIPDNQTNKQALQSLETGLETHVGDLANPHNTTFTQTATADPNTDITAAEAEELTDGSTTSLHNHRQLVDETSTDRVEVLNGGDVQISNYPQTRNDTTSNDEKVLTTDGSGNIVLRRVLPFYDSIKKISDASGSVGVNQTTTLEDWLVFNVTIPETGNYDIDWTYVWSYNDGANDFLAQILLDGSPISTYSEHRQEPKDSAGAGINLSNTTGGITNTGTDQRHRIAGFEPERSLTAGAHTIIIQWASTTDNDEAAIYEGAIRIKRVS